MDIKKKAQAGSLESGDVYITIEPQDEKNPEIELESLVMEQYGRQIMGTIEEILSTHQVYHAKITVRDRGALEYAIRARMETALARAGEEDDQ